jgi:DNA-binding CsgD family transcriptional regulator
MGTKSCPDFGDPLSFRELQVLQGMASGRSNGQIGATLFLSEDTIKSHSRRLFKKLGARDRAHAVWLGVVEGHLQIPVVEQPEPRRPVPERTVEVPPTQVEWLRKPQGTHPVRCYTAFGCQCQGQTVEVGSKVVAL